MNQEDGTTKGTTYLNDVSNTSSVAFQTYSSPTPGEFPIMGICSNNQFESGTFTPTTLQIFKDAGFNFVQRSIEFKSAAVIGSKEYAEDEDKAIAQLLNDAKAIGLRVMVRPKNSSKLLVNDDKSFITQKENWERIVTKFYNHEAVAGWMLGDEPGPIEDSKSTEPPLTYQQVIERLHEVQQSIMRLDPWNHPVYINIGTFRGYRESSADDIPIGFKWISKYNTIVRTYLNNFGPAVLSASCYPIADGYIGITRVRDGALEDLEIFKRLSYTKHRPFWGYVMCAYKPTFVQADGHYIVDQKTGNVARVRLTETEIANIRTQYKIQVHVNLAFGVQGICWWSVVAPGKTLIKGANTNEGIRGYRWAPIDWDGSVNEDLMQEVVDLNEEIKRTSDIFLNATVLETRLSTCHGTFINFFPKNAEGKPFKTMTYPFGPLKNGIMPTEKIDKNGGTKPTDGFLISLLYNRNRTYLVFVNLEIEKEEQEMKLTFNRTMRRLRVQAEDTQEIIINPDKEYTLTSAKGQWAIFVIE